MTNWQRWKGIMKCYPFEEKRLAKWKPPWLVQPKFDGVRCRAVPLANGEYILLSSEENVIFSVPHINKALKPLRHTNYEFDGELYHRGLSFESILSITSRTKNLHSDREMMQFHIFDIVDEGKAQLDRTSELSKLNYLPSGSALQLSPVHVADTLEDIMKTYDMYIDMGYEGIIVRHLNAPYIRKRSIWVMKFKPKQEDVYEILGYEEEVSVTGRFKNSLGSLILKSGDGETFKVGSGFTGGDRQNLWTTRESIIGKSVKVQYQHMTSGRKVPRFPIFMEVIN